MSFVTTILDGGLDLQSHPIAVKPGSLYECDNFEVSTRRGYRRVEGYERFDGGPSPSSSLCVGFFATGSVPSNSVGKYADIRLHNVAGDPGLLINDALVVYVGTPSGGSTFVCVRPKEPFDDFDVQTMVTPGVDMHIRSTPGSTEVVVPYVLLSGPSYPLEDGTFEASEWQTAADTAYTSVRAKVQAVPGTGPVVGLFWMKDALYAARDCIAWSATSVSETLKYGDTVNSSASGGYYGVVLSVEREPDGSGTVVLHSTHGSKPEKLYIGSSAVATLGSAADSPGAQLYKAIGRRETGTSASATSLSWLRQDTGFSLRFNEGTIDFPSLNRFASGAPDEDDIDVTDWFVAGTLVDNEWTASSGDSDDVLDSITDDNGDTAYIKGPTPYQQYAGIRIKNFGITDTDIPDGSILSGLEVEVKRRAYVFTTDDDAYTVRDYAVRWELGTTIFGNFGDAVTTWPKSTTTPDDANYETKTYGGPTDLLGCTGINVDTVKDSDFALALWADTSNSNIQPRITLVRMRVHYIPPQPSFYIWDGDTAQVIRIVKSYVDSGDADTDDAAGTLFVMVDGNPRAVTAGEEIRSMPQPGVEPDGGASDNSTLVAKVATTMTPNLLDGSEKIKAAKSKYQHVTANFYARADFEAMHVASGAGPAFVYDGYAFARVLTGTPIEDDKPRHVGVHQGRLFLGYASGSVQYSAPGEPLDFSATNGAGEIGAGSPVTGMFSLNGQTLAIFCRDFVKGAQGDIGIGPSITLLSPNNGCIEYTAIASGSFLYTSNRGIESLGQTSAYGDFANVALSERVTPFLTPRVQKTIRYEGEDRSVLFGIVVRNKSQYRLFFADGRILTGTFLEGGSDIQYTTQTHPDRWNTVCVGTESTGRDRIFGALNDNNGYVFELDRGNKFDDADIDAYVVLSIEDQQASYLKKTYTDGAVHGSAYDWATFSLSRGIDYDPPDSDITVDQVFGDSENDATMREKYFVSYTEIRVAGQGISFRFDVSTGKQPPLTLQAVSYNAIPMGEKRT